MSRRKKWWAVAGVLLLVAIGVFVVWLFAGLADALCEGDPADCERGRRDTAQLKWVWIVLAHVAGGRVRFDYAWLE